MYLPFAGHRRSQLINAVVLSCTGRADRRSVSSCNDRTVRLRDGHIYAVRNRLTVAGLNADIGLLHAHAGNTESLIAGARNDLAIVAGKTEA